MKTANFNDTVDILVKAYLNDTLQRSNCYACAVGNLVVHHNGYGFKKSAQGILFWDTYEDRPDWFSAVMRGHVRGDIDIDVLEKATKQAHQIGYTIKEVARIEVAFENPTTRGHHDSSDRIFDGLMAVVDVLAEIHGISLEAKTEAKAMFVKL